MWRNEIGLRIDGVKSVDQPKAQPAAAQRT
jgi:hypothetical protein